jgi:hypothetical protein
MNIIQNTIHKSTRKPHLTILVIPFSGEFEEKLAVLGHCLAVVEDKKVFDKYWQEKSKPPNMIFFPAQNDALKISKLIQFDLIICNNRTNYGAAHQLKQYYQIPVVVVEHELADLQDWEKTRINNKILEEGDIIINGNSTIHKHWGGIGYMFTSEDEWQQLFYQLTRGGFDLKK